MTLGAGGVQKLCCKQMDTPTTGRSFVGLGGSSFFTQLIWMSGTFAECAESKVKI